MPETVGQSESSAPPSGPSRESLRGLYLQTPDGWGICIADEPDADLQIALNWRPSDGKRVVAPVRREDVVRKSICAAGACVRTSFGTGVVLGFRPEDGMYQVQLWGPLGRGRNQASLREEALLEVIPASVGLAVDTPYGTGVCRRYFPGDKATQSKGKFLVDLPWGHAYLKAECVKCPMALTLPLIDRFLDRAADVFKMHSGSLARLREALNSLGLERLQERVTASAAEAMEMASKMWDDWDDKDAAVDVKDVYNNISLKADEVMADPKMKSVLEAGITRLNMMVCQAEGFDGVWIGKVDEQPRCVIKDATITWHWGEDSELEIWASDSVVTVLQGDICRGSLTADNELVWDDGDTWVNKGRDKAVANGSTEDSAFDLTLIQESLQDLRKIIGNEEFEGDVEGAFNQLQKIASEDTEVQKIVDEMNKQKETIFQLRGEVLESKAGKVLFEGHARLEAKLLSLQATELTPEVEKMQIRGQRFLTRLSTDKKTKNKAMEILNSTQSRFMAHLNDPKDETRGGIEAWVTSVKDTVVEQLSTHRAILVDSLGGLNLQDIDLRELIAGSFSPVDLERQLSLSLVQGMKISGIDQSGTELLDYFESSESMAQLPVLQQTYRSILSVLDDIGIEVPEAMRGLLEAQAAGHTTDMDMWKGAVMKSLDDELVVQGASDLVTHGETIISHLEELKTSKTVARVMEQFENEDIERAILTRLYDIDTEAMLNTAEGAFTNMEDRDALVDQLKDICLDFILRILPAINIEKLSGHDNGCDWELNDINFSDFHFQKENVHIILGDPMKRGEELLRVSAWDISAHFRKLKVSIDRKEFPPVKQDFLADAKAEGMSVAFAFKLVPGEVGSDWKIEMSSRSVQMESLELWVQSTGYAMIINALSFIFADVLKGYAIKKIGEHLDEHMTTLTDAINTVIQTCVPVLEKLGWSLPTLEDGSTDGPTIEEVDDGEAGVTSEDLEWAVIDWADPGRTFAVRI